MDLSTLTSDELSALKARLDGLTDTTGRSPVRRGPLHDLRLLPQATDPRPMFVWSADQPRDYRPEGFKSFPKLLWSESGEERTIQNETEEGLYLAQGWTANPPMDAAPIDPLAAMKAEYDALSEDDQRILMEAQRQDRMRSLQARLASLPAEKVEALLNAAEPVQKRGKKAVA